MGVDVLVIISRGYVDRAFGAYGYRPGPSRSGCEVAPCHPSSPVATTFDLRLIPPALNHNDEAFSIADACVLSVYYPTTLDFSGRLLRQTHRYVQTCGAADLWILVSSSDINAITNPH